MILFFIKSWNAIDHKLTKNHREGSYSIRKYDWRRCSRIRYHREKQKNFDGSTIKKCIDCNLRIMLSRFLFGTPKSIDNDIKQQVTSSYLYLCGLRFMIIILDLECEIYVHCSLNLNLAIQQRIFFFLPCLGLALRIIL